MKLFGMGQDESFFELLEQQAEEAVKAAQAFHRLTQDYGSFADHLKTIKEIEHQADELTHTLANKIDSTFVTPLDKEDLNALSTRLDDVTDAIDDTVSILAMYRIPALRPDIAVFADLLVQTMKTTKKTVECLRSKSNREGMQPLFIQIHEYENRGDDAYRQAISELYHAHDRDPFTFIAWKEVYDHIETALDLCEDVANTVESVVVKYA